MAAFSTRRRRDAETRKVSAPLRLCAFALALAACAPISSAAIEPTPPTPVPPTVAASPAPQVVFVTVTPLPSLPALPTTGPTVTAAPEDLPPTPGTPCPDQACASAAEHFWLARPIPPDANIYVDRTYAYGSTQQGQREPHHGVEFVNRAGTPALAVAPGVVVVAGDDSLVAYGPATRFYGQLVVVRLDEQFNGQDVYTLYAHLSAVTAQVGQTVMTGDVLGLVGQTGVAIGPHLHFEVRVGRNAYTHTRNPELWLKPLIGANNTPYGALAGRITDLDGNVLYDLPVVVRPLEVGEPTRARYLTTYARETLNGDDALQENFALGDLPAGTYRVAVNTTTFYEQTVRIQPGRLTWVVFTVKAPER